MTFDPTASRSVRRVARAGYVVIVLLATLTNFHFDPDPVLVGWRLHRALIFVTRGADVVDAARNVALFAGFGAVWLATSPRGHPWRRVAWITLLGGLLSVSVELAQLYSATRTSSVNDVVTNTLGALLGSAGVVIAAQWLRYLRPRARLIGVPMAGLAVAYGGAVAAEIFSPLYRREQNPGGGGSIANRLGNALHYLRPFSLGHVSLTDMALFAPAGVVVQLALAECGLSGGWACWGAVVAGIVVSAGVEVAHGVAGQPIEVSAVIGHSVAMAVGALAAWWGGARAARRLDEPRRARLVAGALGVLLVAWAWRPFVPRTRWQELAAQVTIQHLTPLGVLGATTDLFGVMDVAEQFFLYVSLGVVLAAWPVRYEGRLANVLAGVYLAVVLEVGQILVSTRIFDITDLLTQCAAIGVGFVIARRAGYEARGELVPAWKPVPLVQVEPEE